jgi:hypothetical protein
MSRRSGCSQCALPEGWCSCYDGLWIPQNTSSGTDKKKEIPKERADDCFKTKV